MDDHLQVCPARRSHPPEYYQDNIDYSQFQLESDSEEEDDRPFSNFSRRLALDRYNRIRQIQELERNSEQEGMMGFRGNDPFSRGMTIIDTRDSEGNFIRRVIPAGGNALGPPMIRPRPSSLINFIELLNLLARRQGEQGLTS